MKKFTVALIGCGKIGFWRDYNLKTKYPMSHFRNFQMSPHFSLQAIIEADKKTRKIIGNDFHIPTYADYKSYLDQRERCDVVCIASPDNTHEEILQASMALKPKLIYCEKPLGQTFESVKEIVKQCKKNKISLMVNYSRRFIPAYLEIREKIKSGTLGKIQHVTINYSRGLRHNGSHYLDLIIWFWGMPQRVTVLSRKKGLYENDPTISCVFHYPHGLEIYLTGTETNNTIINEFDIIGSKGRIRVNTDGLLEYFEISPLKGYTEYNAYHRAYASHLNPGLALPGALKNIHSHLTKGEELFSDGKNDLDVFQLINYIDQQYA